MIIREAASRDRPTLVRFMSALQETERALEPNRAPGPEIAGSHLASLERWTAKKPGGGVLVAELDGALAGFLVAGVITDTGTYRPPETRTLGWISDLWVEPDARGRGIGRALIAAAEDRFRAAGLTRVELAAVVGNIDAVRLYEHLGYSRYEIMLAKNL